MNSALLSTAAPEPDQAPLAGGTARELLWLFPKHGDARLTANFSLAEFHCGCRNSECYTTLIHPRLVDTLQTLRELLARPVVLDSGYRCRPHNDRIGGRPRSFHMQGMAADIVCASPAGMDELLQAARRIPAVGGLGSYPAKGFVHLDIRRRERNLPIVEWSD